MSTRTIVFALAVCVGVSGTVAYFTGSWAATRAATKSPTQVQAREFVLVDDHGRVGAKLGWKDGQPQLQLFDRKDRVRSAMFLEPNGVPDLYLYDSNNVARASLDLFDSGVPNLAFTDENGKILFYTELDQHQSYNTVFMEMDKGAPVRVTARKMTADASGLHISDSIRGRDELLRERQHSSPN
jgi:hypothetical protein